MRTRALLAASLAMVCGTAVVAGCSKDAEFSVNYLIDGAVTTYNTETLSGGIGGGKMALARVLPGFSYLGPDGRVIADTDIGTATPQPVDPARLTVNYQINPRAVYSDGVPLTCDAITLAWAAHSARFSGFEPVTTAGYRDIESVECTPGAKTATVTFRPGRAYRDWKGLFGAGTLIPPQVVARASGVPDVVGPISRGDRRVLGQMARIWNTGLSMTPGEFESADFPALGPYRVQDYTRDGGLVLSANDRWWGQPAGEQQLTLWPRSTAMSDDFADGKGDSKVDVLDIGAGTYSAVDPAPRRQSSSTAAPPPGPMPPASLGVERIVMAGRGVFSTSAARRAFAACVPRDGLAREFGRGAPIANNHLLGPGDLFTAALDAEFGRDYLRADPERAAREARESEAGAAMTVRIGYLGPDMRRGQMVAAITASCQRAGITVVDAASETIGPASLGADVDALITASGNGFAATGAADPIRDSYAFHRSDPSNIGRYSNARVSALIDQLAVTVRPAGQLPLLREIELLLWQDMPALPLFVEPRTRLSGDNVDNVVPGNARVGTGWNIDRWMLSDT
ncbi:ABC transporter substrate-binding protein [Williamsia muralis]|uniref:ABC transporter substrate-binding protein n=1 Tax=Williamsia marianensis TaxID=85044 RepID=UPI003F1755D5